MGPFPGYIKRYKGYRAIQFYFAPVYTVVCVEVCECEVFETVNSEVKVGFLYFLLG